MVSSTLAGQYTQANSAAGLSTPALPVTAGELLLVWNTADTTLASAVSDTGGNTWYPIGSGLQYDSTHGKTSLRAWFAIAKATTTTTVTFVNSGNAYATSALLRIANTKQDSTALDAYAYMPQESTLDLTSHTSSQITTSGKNDIIVAIWCQDETTGTNTMSDNGSIGGALTLLPGAITSYTNGAVTSVFYKVVSSAGTYDSKVTNTLAVNLGNLIVAFKGD
jgi:hypothetical protein